jgi:hypothetical protein
MYEQNINELPTVFILERNNGCGHEIAGVLILERY